MLNFFDFAMKWANVLRFHYDITNQGGIMSHTKTIYVSILSALAVLILIIVQLQTGSESNFLSIAIILIATISFLQLVPRSRKVNTVISFFFFLIYFRLFGGYTDWTSWIIFVVIAFIISIVLYFTAILVDKANSKIHK